MKAPMPMPTPSAVKISKQANTMPAIASPRTFARGPPQQPTPARVLFLPSASAREERDAVTCSQITPCAITSAEDTMHRPPDKRQRMPMPIMIGANTRMEALIASGSVRSSLMALTGSLYAPQVVGDSDRKVKGGGGGGGGGGRALASIICEGREGKISNNVR